MASSDSRRPDGGGAKQLDQAQIRSLTQKYSEPRDNGISAIIRLYWIMWVSPDTCRTAISVDRSAVACSGPRMWFTARYPIQRAARSILERPTLEQMQNNHAERQLRISIRHLFFREARALTAAITVHSESAERPRAARVTTSIAVT
jgi:hypothetical protein